MRFAGYRYLVRHGHSEFMEMPLDVRDISDQKMAEFIFEANVVRRDLTPLDRAKFFKKCKEEFDMTDEEVAAKHHCSRSHVINSIRLLDLPDGILEDLKSKKITENHAIQLLRLDYDPDLQKAVMEQTLKQEYTVDQLTNNITLTIFQNSQNMEAGRDGPKFDTTDCLSCQHYKKIGNPYSSNSKTWRCLEAKCWQEKQDEAEKELVDKMDAEIAVAKKGQETGILDLDTLISGRDYEELGSFTQIDNPGECKACKNSMMENPKFDLSPVASAFSQSASGRRKNFTKITNRPETREEERQITFRLKKVRDQLKPEESLSIIREWLVKDLSVEMRHKVASMDGYKLPGRAAEDIQELTAKLKEITDTSESLRFLAGLLLQKVRYELAKDKFEYILANMEGHPEQILEKIKAYQNKYCQRCNSLKSTSIALGFGNIIRIRAASAIASRRAKMKLQKKNPLKREENKGGCIMKKRKVVITKVPASILTAPPQVKKQGARPANGDQELSPLTPADNAEMKAQLAEIRQRQALASAAKVPTIKSNSNVRTNIKAPRPPKKGNMHRTMQGGANAASISLKSRSAAEPHILANCLQFFLVLSNRQQFLVG